MSNKSKTQKGITLIALIITVIVLLILAGTAISIAINGGDIFGKASQAREGWNGAVDNEQREVSSVLGILNGIESSDNPGTIPNQESSEEQGNSTPTPTPTANLASKDTTINNGKGYIGYYADFDGTPGVDGIIYADLLVQKPTSGYWDAAGDPEDEIDVTFTIPTTVTAYNVKDYVISETPVTDVRFENAEADSSTYTPRYVITPANNSSGTESRFYVMGLDDITDGTYDTFFWYKNAYKNGVRIHE